MDTGTVVAAVAALAVVSSGSVWRHARSVVTVIHEGGHGLAALLAGRRINGIRIHRDTSGSTLTQGRRSGVGLIVTAGAGYLAPAVIGVMVALLASRDMPARALIASLVILALVLLYVRNFYGLLVVAACGAATAALVWRAPVEGQLIACQFISFFLALGALRDSFALIPARRRGSRSSDADVLARATRVPAVLWCVFFVLVSAASVVVTAGLYFRFDLVP